MKKNIYMYEKRKKKSAAETNLGYCPNCVTIQWKLYPDIGVLGMQLGQGTVL